MKKWVLITLGVLLLFGSIGVGYTALSVYGKAEDKEGVQKKMTRQTRVYTFIPLNGWMDQYGNWVLRRGVDHSSDSMFVQEANLYRHLTKGFPDEELTLLTAQRLIAILGDDFTNQAAADEKSKWVNAYSSTRLKTNIEGWKEEEKEWFRQLRENEITREEFDKGTQELTDRKEKTTDQIWEELYEKKVE